MKKELTWRVILELNRLYREHDVKSKEYVIHHPYLVHLESYGHIEFEKKLKIKTRPSYSVYYERVHLNNFERYYEFLATNNLLEPYWNFKEEDILTLMIIRDNRDTILNLKQTQNQISSFFFRDQDAKYLRGNISLSKAILRILGLTDYPEDKKDQQFIICVPVKKPKIILLCENLDKLRMPGRFRDSGVELWYSGGRNIAKLAHIRENETLPFYYVCDWDQDGLEIYNSIKKSYIPQLNLVLPNDWEKVKKAIGSHKSVWENLGTLTNLTPDAFSLAAQLKENGDWIEEESFEFDIPEIQWIR